MLAREFRNPSKLFKLQKIHWVLRFIGAGQVAHHHLDMDIVRPALPLLQQCVKLRQLHPQAIHARIELQSAAALPFNPNTEPASQHIDGINNRHQILVAEALLHSRINTLENKNVCRAWKQAPDLDRFVERGHKKMPAPFAEQRLHHRRNTQTIGIGFDYRTTMPPAKVVTHHTPVSSQRREIDFENTGILMHRSPQGVKTQNMVSRQV